ncbi:MAG: LysR family transcriptional regulator [Frankia sp.]|nr:LysR family transcriptional regulator [Frankia sp.]
MTPAQLRAFVAVVRQGSVKGAASELGVSEAAVSLHVAQLRKELGDKLFVRATSGLAFTPGGLRLASRATEMLGLQAQTIREVTQAGGGRRLLRIGASSLFAELAAPGLIELFAERADDLDVELSIRGPRDFASLLISRTVDVTIGPQPPGIDAQIASTQFLKYQMIAVASPDHPLARINPSLGELREQTWLLGPSAAEESGVVPRMIRRLNIAEHNQQIFQNHSAALEEAKRGKGIALAVSFAVQQDLARGDLRRIPGQLLAAQGAWYLHTLGRGNATPAAAELARFVTTPRATQAMLRGTGVAVGRFRPSIYVTLWS